MTDAIALRRDPAQAQIAGVCAGLARRWGWQPRSVRILFVLIALFSGGYAVGAYLSCWALIPRDGTTVEPIRSALSFTRNWSRPALVAAVVTTTFVVLGVSNGGPGALFIMGIVWLVMRNSHRQVQPTRTPPPPPPPSTEFERLGQAWQQRLANVDAGLPADWEVAPAPVTSSFTPSEHPETTRTAVRRRRGHRTWLWVLVGLGLAYSAIVATGVQSIGGGLLWVGSTLLVLGLALVLVSRPSRAMYGRPRGLMLMTVLTGLATVVMLVGSQIATSIPNEPVHRAISSSTPLGNSNLGVGAEYLDLSSVEVTQDWAVDYAMDAGSMTIKVPATGNVRVVPSVDIGEVVTPGASNGGMDVTLPWERITDDGPVLTITAVVDIGRIEVTT